MNETIENLKIKTRQRREEEVCSIADMLIEAKREIDAADRRKEVIMESAFERISQFAVDRMAKGDLDSLSKLYCSIPLEFRVWLDKTRDIYELTTGGKLEEKGNG